MSIWWHYENYFYICFMAEDVKITIRVPLELKDAFEEKAKQEKRSFNSQILVVMEEFLKHKS